MILYVASPVTVTREEIYMMKMHSYNTVNKYLHDGVFASKRLQHEDGNKKTN